MPYRDRIAQRFGGPATLLLSYGFFFLVFVGYMLAHSPWMLLSLVILRGWAYGLCWVSTVRLTNERAPKDLTATAQSIMNASFYGIAPLLASPIGGVLYDRFGPRSVFVFAGVLVGMAG